MDDIKQLLEKSGLLSLKESGLTIVSLYGVSEAKRPISRSNAIVTLANRIVGTTAFTSRNEPLIKNTVEIATGLQLFMEAKSKTVYLFMDSSLDTASLAKEKSCSASTMNHQSNVMRGLLFMMITSHLVIPMLPPSVLPTDFLSMLVALNQIKANMHTHLAQYQSSCWKHWNILVPNSLFEKKENERMNPSLMGWWGSAKGVPILVFVATDIPFSEIVPASIKRMQDTLQVKVKNIFRALHLIPLKPEGNTSNPPVEVRSLFLLPSTSQPVIHIVPAVTKDIIEQENRCSKMLLDEPVSLSAALHDLAVAEPHSTALYHDYSDKLLRNFVAIWTKTAISRHPLHNNSSRKSGEAMKSTPLPTPMQFASSAVPLLSFVFNKPITENGVDFKKVITTQCPSTKGMIQQIEVILRKKIKDNIEIERVFSKSHSMDIMQKCNEAYLQDSPPFYTEQYHTWKRNSVMRMYRSLARGPCVEDFASRLERECDSVWKQGRQSCECISLTGKACRLKIGHENEAPPAKQSRDERVVFVDTAKHNSGFNFFHACNCGKMQRVRDDPFNLEDANINFYKRFSCCLGSGRAALDIKSSAFGENQDLVLNYDEIPPHDTSLLYLGPASIYKNNVGLDKVEGFMNNTNFLIPWSITTLNEVKLRQQEAIATAKNNDPVITSASKENTFLQSNNTALTNHDSSEWPVLGKAPYALKTTNTPHAAPIVASLEAFPALGSNPGLTTTTPTATLPTSTQTTAPASNTSNRQLFDTRRRRHHRSRDRVQGLIRGYIGAEYECPHGHRFLSCGEGRVCKLGHAGHPKEHGNYFVHQDLPIFVICPCTYANSANSGANNGGSSGAIGNNNNSGNNLEITAQLQRLYVITPDEAISISMEPRIKINIPGTEESAIVNLDISDSLSFGPGGAYVLRLPFIYRDTNGSPIPVEMDVQRRLKSAILQKDYIKFHYKEADKWIVPN